MADQSTGLVRASNSMLYGRLGGVMFNRMEFALKMLILGNVSIDYGERDQ